MAAQKVKMTVSGRVQGVGFRWGTYQLAQRYHIKGSCWNEPDGTVGIEAQSENQAALAAFEREIRKGATPWSHVTYVDVAAANFPDYSDFRMKN